MRRTLDIVAVTGIAAALLFVAAPLWAPTYTYVRKEVANSWSAVNTFLVGVAVTSGQRVILDAGTAVTYLLRDADTGCWQEWKDGTLGWQLCADGVVPPDCTSTG